MNLSLLIVAQRQLRLATQHSSKAFLIACAAGLLSVTPAQATVYYSNLGVDASELVSPFNNDNMAAFSFTTGDGVFRLDSFQATIRIHTTMSPPGGPESGSLFTHLYATDSNSLPSTQIAGATFTYDPITVDGTYTITFTASSYIQLEANTTYAIAVGATGNLFGQWVMAEDLSSTGEWTAPAGTPFTLAPNFWVDGSNGNYRHLASISATPIPEPSTFALVGAAGAIAWTLRRRRVA